MNEPFAEEPSYWVEPLPRDEDDVRARHAANRAAWNEGAGWYTAAVADTIDYLRNGGSNLHPLERRNLGDLQTWCRFAIHLQCASGRDTLSLWNEGVERVAGVDISDIHIENARQTSTALIAPAEWYRCDVLDTPHSLDSTADLVYTGRGALCWLHDLNAWATVCARLLKPGGVLHVFDGHPITYLFSYESTALEYSGVSYFGHAESNQGWPSTYIGDSLNIPTEQQARKFERLWTIADVVNAVTGAGLVLEYLGEHPDSYFEAFPRLQPGLAERIPQTFSLKARKPSASGL